MKRKWKMFKYTKTHVAQKILWKCKQICVCGVIGQGYSMCIQIDSNVRLFWLRLAKNLCT